MLICSSCTADERGTDETLCSAEDFSQKRFLNRRDLKKKKKTASFASAAQMQHFFSRCQETDTSDVLSVAMTGIFLDLKHRRADLPACPSGRL